jgi:hypothetical protein
VKKMRRIILLVTVAFIMASLLALNASTAFAAQPMELPSEADCGLSVAESNAPDQADEQIPQAQPAMECHAAGGPPK